MGAIGELLADAGKSGIYQLHRDARQLERAAADAGLAAWRVDFGGAHDKDDFLRLLSVALDFPRAFGRNWDAMADCLRDLSWVEARGYVLILERSRHFCDLHKQEFDEAVGVLAEAADFWRGEGKPFWALIVGPEGWDSGYPAMPLP